MTLAVTVGSVRHSPGVSTLSLLLALAWPTPDRERVVVGADPDGCDFAARYGLGVEPGLVSLAMNTRHTPGPVDITAHSRELTAGIRLIPGPISAEEATTALGIAAASLAMTAAADSRVWFVDGGRLTTRSASLAFAARSMITVLIARGRPDELQPVPARVEALKSAGCEVALIVVGSHGYTPVEIATFAGCEVLGVIPDDQTAGMLASQVLAGGKIRSKLWPAVMGIAANLALRVEPRLIDTPPAPSSETTTSRVGVTA